jgi:hypothetical protein
MGIGIGALADLGGAAISAPAAALAQAANAQVAIVQALFGSLGLGTNVDAVV